MLVGVDQETFNVFQRSGFIERVGAENVIPTSEEVLGDLEQALTEANTWVAQRQAS